MYLSRARADDPLGADRARARGGDRRRADRGASCAMLREGGSHRRGEHRARRWRERALAAGVIAPRGARDARPGRASCATQVIRVDDFPHDLSLARTRVRRAAAVPSCRQPDPITHDVDCAGACAGGLEHEAQPIEPSDGRTPPRNACERRNARAAVRRPQERWTWTPPRRTTRGGTAVLQLRPDEPPDLHRRRRAHAVPQSRATGPGRSRRRDLATAAGRALLAAPAVRADASSTR